MSSISLFDIISVVFPDPNTFLCILASAADAAAVKTHKTKGVKTLLANGLITFFTKTFFSSDQVI